MKRQRLLVITAFLITMEIVAASLKASAQQKAFEYAGKRETVASGRSRLTPVRHKGNTNLDQAFQDAISILSKNNSCSRFFGGPGAAEEVLNHLSLQFQIGSLRDSKTGIEMSGNFTYFGETEEHAGYRLFATATINTRGPFFRAKVFPAEPYVPPIGSFRPNTREARVLMLLHELAHLVRGRQGSWLIPDDGNLPSVSAQNTALIESHCKAQILWLSVAATNQIASN